MLQVLYVHGAEVFAKTKLPGFLMLLSFNKCSISALAAPIYQYIVNRVNAIGENSNLLSQLRKEFHCASSTPYHVFLSCDVYTPAEKNPVTPNFHNCRLFSHSCILINKFITYVNFLLLTTFNKFST